MERITIDEIDPVVDSATVKRPLTDALGAAHLVINAYELDPGDSFAYGYHVHERQEEVFIITAGTVTFETADGDVRVNEGEVVRFAPGEYQQGTNRGDERVEAIVLGAPQESGNSEILRTCEHCGERTPQSIEWTEDREAKLTRCGECGRETGRFG